MAKSQQAKSPMSDAPGSTAPPTAGRWQGWLIIGLLVAGMVLAYLVFPRTAEDRRQLLSLLGTSNKGELMVPPRQIQDVSLQYADGRPWQLAEQAGRWRLVLPVAGDCSDGNCAHLLYTARQVHTRLAEKSPRVERLLVNVGPPFSDAFQRRLRDEYPGMKLLRAEPGALAALLAEGAVNPGERLYIMDPAGFVMMAYGREHPGGDMLTDIKRLLKYSREN
ncbi:hypothetical protein [Exilibacterium tricleocarpae]|uniref:hypothetical protein n=1 Tax=Exilibacterium tricleocarpae TaxID=2591008 RepID=UPI00115EA767|nr:hypothetical protein [Exilibacterium tricleocarpae]